MSSIRSTTLRGISQNAFTSPWCAIDDAPVMITARRERGSPSHRVNGGDTPCDQRRMRGWSSRLLSRTERCDSVAPLSCFQRKIGSFASPPRGGFALVVVATVLRFFLTVNVSQMSDEMNSRIVALRCYDRNHVAFRESDDEGAEV